MRGGYYVFLLMAAIRGITFKFDGYNHPPHSIHDAKQYLYRYHETGHTTNIQYLDTFKNNLLVIESYF